MKIPKKIKIGGTTYKVCLTNNISAGNNYNGEILYDDRVINIRPCESQELTFLHETVHGIMKMGGYYEHDEQMVEILAQGLLAVIKDNKGLFEENDK